MASQIYVELVEDVESFRLTVSDNGLGLTQEASTTIFAMFAQVDGHREHSHGGLRIGLALVKQLVELHEGSITVQSDGPGRGVHSFSTYRRLSNCDHPNLPSGGA